MHRPAVEIRADHVVKSFHGRWLCRREAASYELVHRLLDGVDLGNGWTARAPGILKRGRRRLVMSRMPGETMDRLIRTREPVPWDKVGAALGHFHRLAAVDDCRARLISDISRSNVMIDAETRSVALIDPGARGGRIGDPLEDLLTLLWGLFTVRLAGHRLSGAEQALARGWSRASGIRPTSADLATARRLVVSQLDARHTRRGGRHGAASRVLLPVWAGLWLPVVLGGGIADSAAPS